MHLECMSLPFLPYLSQILMKLLETLTSLQEIKISIHLCNLRDVILVLCGTINFTTKSWLQPVWTGFFRVVDRLGPVFKGPVAVPEYLKRSRPIGCQLPRFEGKKLDLTGFENTRDTQSMPTKVLVIVGVLCILPSQM